MSGSSGASPEDIKAESAREGTDVLLPARGIAHGVVGGALIWALVLVVRLAA